MDEMILFSNISFGYESTMLLNKVCMQVNKGDFAALVGANGAGKSTMLRLLLGQLTANSGEILLMGHPLREFRNWREVGYVPQTGSLNLNFPATVREIVQLGLYRPVFASRPAKKARTRQVEKALETVGMRQFANRLLSNLSGGQQQRVMIAKALVNEPQLLVLDEPTAGIDAPSIESLYALLDQLNATGVTILMITHEIERMAEHFNTIFLLKNGRLRKIAAGEDKYV